LNHIKTFSALSAGATYNIVGIYFATLTKMAPFRRCHSTFIISALEHTMKLNSIFLENQFVVMLGIFYKSRFLYP